MSARGRAGAGSEGANAHAYSSVVAPEAGRALKTASRWWISGGIGLVAVIALGTAAAILTAHGNAVSLAQRELQNMALVLASRATSEFEAIERVQTNLIERIEERLTTAEDFERKFSSSDVHTMLKEKETLATQALAYRKLYEKRALSRRRRAMDAFRYIRAARVDRGDTFNERL